MKEVNYNETVIIPLLQKKYQELINSNLVLEATLLVEQAKNRDLTIKLEQLELKVSKKKKGTESGIDGDTF
jgi:hypothetical protein